MGRRNLEQKGALGKFARSFLTEITRTESHGEKLATNFTNYTNSFGHGPRVPLVSVMQEFRGTRGLFRVIGEICGELFSVALSLWSNDAFFCHRHTEKKFSTG